MTDPNPLDWLDDRFLSDGNLNGLQFYLVNNWKENTSDQTTAAAAETAS